MMLSASEHVAPPPSGSTLSDCAEEAQAGMRERKGRGGSQSLGPKGPCPPWTMCPPYLDLAVLNDGAKALDTLVAKGRLGVEHKAHGPGQLACVRAGRNERPCETVHAPRLAPPAYPSIPAFPPPPALAPSPGDTTSPGLPTRSAPW